MATGGFNPNCIVPVTASISVGTSAIQVKTSSQLAVKFTIANGNTSAPVYIGDANVSSTRFTAKITTGSSVTIGPDPIIGRANNMSYDLAGFYLRATAASQAAILTTYCKGGTSGSF